MAQVYDERQQHKDAAKLYQEAIRISKIVLGDHQEVANVMNKLGNLYFKIGNLDGAIESYKDGLEVERAVFHVCHPNISNRHLRFKGTMSIQEPILVCQKH